MDDTDDTDDSGHLDGEAIDRRVLDRVRPLLTDPDVTPEEVAALALQELHDTPPLLGGSPDDLVKPESRKSVL